MKPINVKETTIQFLKILTTIPYPDESPSLRNPNLCPLCHIELTELNPLYHFYMEFNGTYRLHYACHTCSQKVKRGVCPTCFEFGFEKRVDFILKSLEYKTAPLTRVYPPSLQKMFQILNTYQKKKQKQKNDIYAFIQREDHLNPFSIPSLDCLNQDERIPLTLDRLMVYNLQFYGIPNTLEYSLSCLVCFQDMLEKDSHPVFLQGCGHTFCWNCIQQGLDFSACSFDTYKCPMCTKETTFYLKDLKTLNNPMGHKHPHLMSLKNINAEKRKLDSTQAQIPVRLNETLIMNLGCLTHPNEPCSHFTKPTLQRTCEKCVANATNDHEFIGLSHLSKELYSISHSLDGDFDLCQTESLSLLKRVQEQIDAIHEVYSLSKQFLEYLFEATHLNFVESYSQRLEDAKKEMEKTIFESQKDLHAYYLYRHLLLIAMKLYILQTQNHVQDSAQKNEYQDIFNLYKVYQEISFSGKKKQYEKLLNEQIDYQTGIAIRIFRVICLETVYQRRLPSSNFEFKTEAFHTSLRHYQDFKDYIDLLIQEREREEKELEHKEEETEFFFLKNDHYVMTSQFELTNERIPKFTLTRNKKASNRPVPLKALNHNDLIVEVDLTYQGRPFLASDAFHVLSLIPNIKTLNLKLSGKPSYDHKILTALFPAIANLTSLNLTIQDENTKIPDLLHLFLDSVYESLESLTIEFKDFKASLLLHPLKRFLKTMLQIRFQKLDKLKIRFNGMKFTPDLLLTQQILKVNNLYCPFYEGPTSLIEIEIVSKQSTRSDLFFICQIICGNLKRYPRHGVTLKTGISSQDLKFNSTLLREVLLNSNFLKEFAPAPRILKKVNKRIEVTQIEIYESDTTSQRSQNFNQSDEDSISDGNTDSDVDSVYEIIQVHAFKRTKKI